MDNRYSKYHPLQKRKYQPLLTTQKIELQLWQQLLFVKFNENENSNINNEDLNSFIEQSQTYYTDASSSNWRSAGLLYYYSFLNLAKAYIGFKGKISIDELKTESLYHGVRAESQTPDDILDFEIEIHPAISKGKKNVFAILYECVTKENWPFTNTVKVKLREIIGYCEEISYENQIFYDVERPIINCVSLLRGNNQTVWLEIMVKNESVTKLFNDFAEFNPEIIESGKFSTEDIDIWNKAFRMGNFGIQSYSIIKLQETKRSIGVSKNIIEIFENAKENQLQRYLSDDSRFNGSWKYIEKLQIQDLNINWSPIFSDYLHAFILSTILRYHPHLYKGSDKNSFTAEAWINQSPINILRFFVSEFTDPSVIIN